MANEFVIKNGFISNGNGFINNNLWVSGNTNLNLLTASTVNLSTIPTNNNSATQVLVRNTSTGDIEYRDSSSISPSAVTDTYVTGFTYTSSANTLTIKQNNGQSDLNTLINGFSSLTVNDLYVTNNLDVSGNTSSATLTTNYISSNNGYVDNFSADTLQIYTSFNINGPVTSNDSITAVSFSGGSFYGDGSNLTGVDDIYVTGGTYNKNSGIITFYQNSGGSFNVTGLTSETYITGGTINISGDTIFTNNTGGTFTLLGSTQYGAGVLQGSSGWTQAFNGTITLPTVVAAVYDNENFIAPLRTYTITGGTSGIQFPALVNNNTNYIFIDYNSGNPIYNISTTDTTNGSNRVRVLTVYRLNNFLHVLDFGNQGSGTSNRIINRIISTERFARENGLSLGVSGTTGVVTLTTGAAWNGINRQELDAVNSQNDIFFQNYHIGGVWTATTTADTFNNIYYDNGTNKVSATTGNYLVNWYYRGQEINDHLYEVWGNNEYATIDDAEASGEPPLPNLVTSHAFLVGRIIIEAGSFSAVTVQSSFSQQFQSSQVTVHNNLSGLQGGSSGEYYHLTQSQYNNNAYTNVNNNFSVGQTFNSDISGGTVYFSGTSNLTTVTAETISNVDYIDFNTSSTVTQSEGRINWDSGAGTLNISVGDSGTGLIDLQVGQEEIVRVYNGEATTLLKGEIVYVSGSQGNRPKVKRASAVNDGYSVTTLGMVDRDITSGAEGYITTFGIISNLNTLGLTGGTPIWLSSTTPGAYTSTKPIAPQHTVLIGYVVRVSATVGSIFINISNGWELDEIHDVRISGVTTGDLLTRSLYNGTPVWVNSKNLNGNYVVNGNFTITGNTNTNILSTNTITGTSYNIQSPTQDDTLDDFLVIDNDGNFFTRNFNSVNYTPNVVTVSLSGGSADFTSVKDACDSITGATSANTYTVRVYGGVFYENPFTIPSWVVVKGDSSVSTIIEAIDSSKTLINLSDQSAIFDCQVQGCTDTGVSAIVYSSSTTPQASAISYVENVRFGANYTHAKVVAYGGANIIMQCSNVKYGGYPFTIGFEATRDVSGIGRMQLRNVTSTNGGITTTTGLIFAKAVQPNCGFIVNGCLLTKSAGAAAGIGFYVENGGFLRLTGVNFQRWATGIYVPQVGSAPSIDAIALNFENCTTDVNIIHSGTTGKIQGTDNFLKTKININAPIYEVNTDAREILVAKKGGDFSSIKSAVDYLSLSANTSLSNRYIISVGPGEFIEDEIDLTNTPYVSIVGSNIQTTLIKPSTSSQHIIKININNEISFLSLSGASSGYAGIYCYDIGDFAQAHKISFYDCDTNVWVESDTQDTKFYGEYLDYNGEYTYGTKVIGNNGYLALANLENYFNFPTGSNITYCNYATGSGATINAFVSDNVSNGVSGTTAFYIQDGAELNSSTVTCDGNTYGLRNPNVGVPIKFDIDNASFVNGEWDLYVERVGTFGTFGGSSSHEKIFTASEDIYWAFLDIDDGEFDITRKASVTFSDGTHTDFTTLLFESGTMGLLKGGEITVVSGFTINTAEGYGYLESQTTPGVVKRIDWADSILTLPSGSTRYIFINENGILSATGGVPDSENNIQLGRVVTNSTTIEFIELSPVFADHTTNKLSKFNRGALGSIYSTGSIVTENTLTPFEIDITNGKYFFSEVEFNPTGGTSVQFVQYYKSGLSSWVTSATTFVNNTQYDNNGTLTGLTTSAYTKHSLYVLGDGSNENYFLVLGQNEYMALIDAENAPLPTPPTYFTDSVTPIASIYVQEGASNIIQIQDIRPVIGFRAAGVTASSVHGNLLGLDADDHTQYLLVSGARAMSGNLNMNNNNIISAGTINGVTIQSHSVRHKYNGADEVGTLTPAAFAIPYANSNGKLDGWVSTGSTSTLGKVKLSAAPTLASDPIAVGTNDIGYLNSYTGATYSANTLTLKSVNNTTDSVTIGLRQKAGTVAGSTFSANPKRRTVTFTTPYPDTNYSIQITGSVDRNFTYHNKTTNGFTINSNANTPFTEDVDWFTIAHGES